MRPRRRFVFAAGIGDEDDGPRVIEQGAGPGCVLAAESDVEAAAKVRRGEVDGVATVEQLRAGLLELEHAVERERLLFASERLVERGPLLRVEHGVVGEVGGRVGLVGCDQRDELRPRHGLQRVVVDALFADGGERLLADRLAAERAGAVCGIDEGGVGQGEQFRQRVVQQAAERVGGEAARGVQVRTADVADEECVAGEHGVGHGGRLREIEDEQRDGVGGVARRGERLQAHLAEFDLVAFE